MGRELTPFGFQMRIVRSLEAVYRAPLPPIPPPPHRTTFTLAEWPPRAYSNLLVALDQTRTVPSLEEDARRGAAGFLRKPKQGASVAGPVNSTGKKSRKGVDHSGRIIVIGFSGMDK